jgi:hypothetical protein
MTFISAINSQVIYEHTSAHASGKQLSDMRKRLITKLKHTLDQIRPR